MWDYIAYKIYQNEGGISYLLEANEKYKDIAVFPAGITLICPDLPAEASKILPPWRR
jgi:phage tail protein X